MKLLTLSKYIISLCILVVVVGCKPKAEVPVQFTEADIEVNIYPDYKDIVVPPNIAPLNFIVRDSIATAYVVQFTGKGQELLAAAADDAVIRVDTAEWRSLLMENKGNDVSVDIYAKRPNGWIHYKPYKISIAEEPIDAFLSYRLIEPGYELYRQLGIYQRNLTTFEEKPIYENNREYDDNNNHCINCHNYRMGSTESMLFHVRSNHGGTIIVQNGKAHKIQLKDSTIIASGVYPSWHPAVNLVAFSTNKTGQAFHLYHPEKVEVLDAQSDLLLYDVTNNEVGHIIRTSDDLETFPCWSPDGRTLYYCSAGVKHLINPIVPDSLISQHLILKYDSIRYNLMSIPFDPESRSFGTPKVVINAAKEEKSISVPRVSPDGRYVLYTKGDYGQFHIWHKSSDLWVMDLEKDTCYALAESNSPDVDSFHSWSSNGRWFVFSSRRMDGNYTRPYIAYFDKQGRAHKAFVLPQEDPEWNILLLKSYNVPELSKDAVLISPKELHQCIYETEGEQAAYKANPTAIVNLDGTTGASPKVDAEEVLSDGLKQ